MGELAALSEARYSLDDVLVVATVSHEALCFLPEEISRPPRRSERER